LRHGMDDMYVLQYETNPERGSTLRTPQPTAVASVNTHDMPQFAGKRAPEPFLTWMVG